MKYDLTSPNDKAIVRQFEKELAGRDWDTYCIAKGYLIRNDRYPDGAIVPSKLIQLNADKDKFTALEVLTAKQNYARKKEKEGLDLVASPPPEAPKLPVSNDSPQSKETPIPAKKDPLDAYCGGCVELKTECTCIKLEDIPF